MRSVLALGLLVTLWAAADAATVHRFRHARGPLTPGPACHCPQGLRCSRLERRTDPVLAG